MKTQVTTHEKSIVFIIKRAKPFEHHNEQTITIIQMLLISLNYLVVNIGM